MRTAIVGAGLAGLACAQALVRAGVQVALFDKGRGAGGRMSSRRMTTPLGEASFDHGAQYMTARDPAFREALSAWKDAGAVAPWPAAGEDAWVGLPAMNAPVKLMSRDLPVRWGVRVETLRKEAGGWRVQGEALDEGGFDAVLTALPAEQTAALLAGVAPAMAEAAASTPSDPCWAAMASFAQRLPFQPDVLRTEGPVSWAARNSAKPGRAGPESWVVQASPQWSRDHLEQSPDPTAADLLAAFFRAAGLDASPPILLAGHRWRYARSGAAKLASLWDAGRGLGACGDWLRGPRVENAWLSGRDLAAAVTVAPAGPAQK